MKVVGFLIYNFLKVLVNNLKMNKYLVLIITICSIFYFSNCSNRNEQKNELINIDIERAINSKTKGISLNEFIDTIIYIPLETNRVVHINEIQKIKFYKDNFFVMDNDGLYKFDSCGRFICKIGNIGKGPEEYDILGNFFIKSDTIFIRSSNRILAFDLYEGNFLNSFQFDQTYRRIYVEKNGNYFVALNHVKNMIEFYNGKGLLIDSLTYRWDKKMILDRAIGFSYYDIFFGTEYSLEITTFCNDTIFEINDKFNLTPIYIAHLGKYKIPDKLRPDVAPWNKFIKNSAAYLRKIPIETRNFLLIQLGSWSGEECSISMPFYPDKKSGLIGLGIYDKRSNKISLISQDEENLPCFYPNYSDGDNHLISFVNPTDAIVFYEQNRSLYRFNKSFNEVIQKLKIDDNPVLILVKLKE